MRMTADRRGSIAFFATYRTPVPLDIFSCPRPTMPVLTEIDELHMTDVNKEDSYNYNGQEIPPAALKTLLKRPTLASYKEADVNSGHLTGMVFVSERGNLELLRIALRFNDDVNPPKVEVFSLADVFGTSHFNGVRMEDTGCIALDHLIYVSTKVPATKRRQPWTAVYKTNLKTGETDRLTPKGHADLSPSVSPSGKKIAVASFEGKMGEEMGKEMEHVGWAGEIEDLKTNIYVMDVEDPSDRRLVVKNGGWPTWGSDDVIFFHRKDDKKKKHPTEKIMNYWGVYRANISSTGVLPERVTPDNIDAFTPAAIDDNTVVVVTVREKPEGLGAARKEQEFRQIEIFDTAKEPHLSTKVTQNTGSKLADHFNPFVIDGGKRIGYHRGRNEKLSFDKAVERPFQTLECPLKDVSLFRVSGVFPTISNDGSKLAFVDNEFKAVWVADKEGLHIAYEGEGPDRVFSPVWDQFEDTLYVCVGPSFKRNEPVNIVAITQVSLYNRQSDPLTDRYNNAFPSSGPEGIHGNSLVYRSTGEDGHKNLYIMENKKEGVRIDGDKPTRLTNRDGTGTWTDTQCQWSRGNWIVFSSTRDKPRTVLKDDNELDPGYFSVYLVNPVDPDVVVRVITSGGVLGGHVNHPFLSPDGLSIVVTSDLAAVSVDPISLPLFEHSVRPYGDIFTIDNIDPDDIQKNQDVEHFTRITHSRYENSTATWTRFSTQDPSTAWKMFLTEESDFNPSCPYAHQDGGESWHMTGHLVIPNQNRCC